MQGLPHAGKYIGLVIVVEFRRLLGFGPRAVLSDDEIMAKRKQKPEGESVPLALPFARPATDKCEVTSLYRELRRPLL